MPDTESPRHRVTVSPHPRVLVIGYGNPLRGDDGIGWRIAQELAETVADPEVQVLARHQLTPELAEPLSHVERVIFIDARVEGAPGSFVYDPVSPAELAPGSFTHNVNPAMLLALARILYGNCPEARVLAVTGAAFEYTEKLSTTILAALPKALARVREDIQTLTRGHGDAPCHSFSLTPISKYNESTIPSTRPQKVTS